VEIPAASDYQTHAGKGVCAVVNGRRVYVGSAEWLKSLGVSVSVLEDWADGQRGSGATVMFAAAENRLLGGFALADGVRATAEEAIRDLNKLGVRSVMLTGDNVKTGNAIGKKLGVSEVRANLLPEDKERVVASLQSEGRKVMMVGDGINDAPALTRADLGVAIGQGTDVAIESADVVLVRDDPMLAAGMIRLGKAVIRNIRQNLFWAFFYNAIGIPLAAGALIPFGIELDPMFAALAMSLSSFCVVTNALRLRGFRLEREPQAIVPNEPGACPVQIQNEIKEENPMKIVHIEGMMCPRCVAHVKKALEVLDPQVEVILEQNCAKIYADVADETLTAAVVEAGYEVTSIEN
jgi:cation transport ATPase